MICIFSGLILFVSFSHTYSWTVPTNPPSLSSLTLVPWHSNRRYHCYDSSHPLFSQNQQQQDTKQQLDDSVVPPCYYKTFDNRWKPRTLLNSLQIGQKLIGQIVQGTELLDGKTGPKLFFECGVGRIDAKGKWQMVNGMLRWDPYQEKNKSSPSSLNQREEEPMKTTAQTLNQPILKRIKPSVLRKKVAKLQSKPMDLYVTQIRLDHGTLEVSTVPPTLSSTHDRIQVHTDTQLISASTLQPGQELIGTVVEVRPYGCMVHVGANRKGLLHIQKIADLYGKYIHKEEGIREAGLELGARIRVAVHSNEKKRLFLDFTNNVKADAGVLDLEDSKRTSQLSKDSPSSSSWTEEELASWAAFAASSDANTRDEDTEYVKDNFISVDDAAEWAAFAATNDNTSSIDDEEDDDDEDRRIEDALGLGSF